jgi:hypothetical protein
LKKRKEVANCSQVSKSKKKGKEAATVDQMSASPVRFTRSSVGVAKVGDVISWVPTVAETPMSKKKKKSKVVAPGSMETSSQFSNKDLAKFWPLIIQKPILPQKGIDVNSFKKKTNLLPILSKGGILGSVIWSGSYVQKVIQEFYCNDMQEGGSAVVRDEDSIEVFLRDKLVLISRTQEELEIEKKRIGKLLLSLHKGNDADNVSTSASKSNEGNSNSSDSLSVSIYTAICFWFCITTL